ncbi:MAG: HD domain-containing phosphohydrolase [Candidatus Methanofastidiosia archaeon]
MEKEKILIVDDHQETRDLLCEILENEGYECRMVANTQEEFDICQSQDGFSLAIVDIRVPEKSGLKLLEEIKKIAPDMAVIILSGIADINVAIESMRKGASGYITKPFRIKELILTVKKAIEKRNLILENRRYQEELERMVSQRTQALKKTVNELDKIYNSTLNSFIMALDIRETESETHSRRVAKYTMMLAKELDMKDKNELTNLERGAILHDIGKIGVPDRILRKPGPLSSEEWQVVRKHPFLGFRMIRDINFFKIPAQIVLHHHEKFDGRGYPYGLKKEEIPWKARIFAVADALEAITSNRPYRNAKSFDYAREEIKKCAESQFDPEVVHAFLSIPLEEWEETRMEAMRSLNRFDLYPVSSVIKDEDKR